ncbi:MAG: hypothetical protein ACFFE8_06360 [Candidatus Heimdallarchaeota archaeon]
MQKSLAQAQNDALMELGYKFLNQCKEHSIPCFLWGGGAIYYFLGGKMDYRKMSDMEFLLPLKVDHEVQGLLEEMGFLPYKTFNNMQNQYDPKRREFYLPSRELSKNEEDNVFHGRKSNVEDAKFKKVELFVNGIRLCWTFKIKDLPSNYFESLICPPGFQIALKAHAIHPDDFDLKDIQDIARVVNSPQCGVGSTDTIFDDINPGQPGQYVIGKDIFEKVADKKLDFAGTIVRNLSEVLLHAGLTQNGKTKLLEIIDFLKPLEEKDESLGFLSRAKKEKPVRVDARTR